MGVASWLKQLRRVPGVNKARHLAEVAVTPYVRGDLAELRAVTERDIADLQARLALIEGSQPLVLNAISSTNGVARLSAREMQSTRDDLTGFVEASLAPHTGIRRFPSWTVCSKRSTATSLSCFSTVSEVRPSSTICRRTPFFAGIT